MDPVRISTLLDPFLLYPLAQERLEQISAYIDLLLRWNARTNLTAIRTRDEIATRHFGESLFAAQTLFPVHVGTAGLAWRHHDARLSRRGVVGRPEEHSSAENTRSSRYLNNPAAVPGTKEPVIPTSSAAFDLKAEANVSRREMPNPEGSAGNSPALQRQEPGAQTRRPAEPALNDSAGTPDASPKSDAIPPTLDLLDLGSGAGFPGIPIHLWAPHLQTVLIESNQKKVAFLREVIRALTLTNINVSPSRAENFPTPARTVTLRAVERFDQILPIAARLLAPQGRLALLIAKPQADFARAALGPISWRPPLPIPQSSTRILLTGELKGSST